MNGISNEPNGGEHDQNEPRRDRDATGGGDGGGGGDDPGQARSPAAEEGRPGQTAVSGRDAPAGDGHAAPIDWAAVKARVLMSMHTTRSGVHADGRRHRAPGYDRARHGNSLEDAVQQAIAETIAEASLPADDDAAFEAVLCRARRRLRTWSETARARDRRLEQMSRTASTVDMLEIIEQRNLQLVAARRLYAFFENDQEAKVLTNLVLERGFDLSKTAEIQAEIGESNPRVVENTKKRFRRGVKHVLAELSGLSREGGTS